MLPLLLGNCMSLRSAKGLSKGEFAVGYTAPAGGTVRYGLVDNLEVRGIYLFDSHYGGDLYLHTSKAGGKVNYGIFAGGIYNTLFDPEDPEEQGDQKVTIYSGMTIGQQLHPFFKPYFTYIYTASTDRSLTHQFSVGTEFEFKLGSHEQLGIIILPEVSYFPDKVSPFGTRQHWWPNVHVGFTFDFRKILSW